MARLASSVLTLKQKTINYLAHAYLSFGHSEILVGNMISDYVKGKATLQYSVGIQKGIALHRFIDGFTDDHEATKRAKEIFRPTYRLYSGAFVDVVYDYFLANDIKEFLGDSLYTFSQEIYEQLSAYVSVFPAYFASVFPYMRSQNWLYNYRSEQGIISSFGGLKRRAKYIEETETAAQLFLKYKDELQDCYDSFWPDVKKNTFQHLQKIL